MGLPSSKSNFNLKIHIEKKEKERKHKSAAGLFYALDVSCLQMSVIFRSIMFPALGGRSCAV